MVDIIITLVICGTVLVAVRVVGSMIMQWSYSKSSPRRDRVGPYKHLLAALSSLEQNPEEDKAWHRFASAVNHVSLVASPEVINEVDRVSNLVRQSSGYLSPDEAQALIKVLRKDVNVSLDASTRLQFRIVPSGAPTRNVRPKNEPDPDGDNA